MIMKNASLINISYAKNLKQVFVNQFIGIKFKVTFDVMKLRNLED